MRFVAAFTLTLVVSFGGLILSVVNAVEKEARHLGGGQVMNEDQKQVVELLDLPDNVYLSRDSENQLSEIRAKLAPEPDKISRGEVLPVLAIGLPHIIDIDKHQHIPGLLAKRYYGLRAWEVDFDQNFQFIVMDMRTGDVKAARSFVQDKRMQAPEPSRSGPPPDDINRNIVTYGIERFNVPKVLGPQWSSPRIAVAVVLYDWLSNSIVVDIHGQNQIREQPAPESASSFLVNTDNNIATQQLAEAGVELLVPSSITANAPASIQVALRLWRREVVLIPEITTRNPLLKASFLLVALDADHPIQVDLLVPVTARKINDERIIEGSFAFDLRTALSGQAVFGKYQSYLVVGARIAGPYPLTVE